MKLQAKNDGVVILVTSVGDRDRQDALIRLRADSPPPVPDPTGHGRGGDNAPLVGYIHARGGRVRWIEEGQAVTFHAANATFFPDDDAARDMGMTAVMIHQNDILGVIEGVTHYGKGGHGTRGGNPVGNLPVGPKTDTRTFYGPHKCDTCGAMIAKVSREEGGLAYDYPDGPIYPNTRWALHSCENIEPKTLITADGPIDLAPGSRLGTPSAEDIVGPPRRPHPHDISRLPMGSGK